MGWYLKVLKNYFGFKGRARRKEYWMFVLISMIVTTCVSFLNNLLGDLGIDRIYELAILIPAFALAFRRLHDTGRSAWWLLLIFIPLLGWLVLLFFMAGKGEAGENRFGPDPKLSA
ncbi:DUF805 domain-containing protein [Enterobacter sp. KBR-315C3_2022]|jgi:Predicted membrane protein|uniref:DUF805 domain-containing protein n=1 Tax=Enterobacter sp. KBR-315C3_2022 TaxID=3242494 RepID=UPI003526F66E